MITHLIDTDVCIQVLKKKNRALLGRVVDFQDNIAVSDITIFELFAGAEKYEDRFRRKSVLEDFLARLPAIALDGDAARHAGEIRGMLEIIGQKIGAYDVLNAGIARSKGLIIATNNLREYNRVPGLRGEKWS